MLVTFSFLFFFGRGVGGVEFEEGSQRGEETEKVKKPRNLITEADRIGSGTERNLDWIEAHSHSP